MQDTNPAGPPSHFFPPFSDDDLDRFGFTSSPYAESHPNNLSGTILLLFSLQNWRNGTYYPTMIPALRLASNFLQSPNSRLFLYNLFHAERKLLKDPTIKLNSNQEARQFDRMKNVPFSEVFKRTTILLDRLAHCIRFSWFDPSDPRRICCDLVGYCKVRHRPAYMSSCQRSTGQTSDICLHPGLVRQLRQLQSSSSSYGSSVSKTLPYPSTSHVYDPY